MYTRSALFNPYLISCTLTRDPVLSTAENAWRTVKWYELEYVLTGEGGGFLKNCQPVRFMLEPSTLGFKKSQPFSYLALHIKNVCNFDIVLKIDMLFQQGNAFLIEPVRASLYSEGSLHGIPQKAGRLKLPAVFSGWVTFRTDGKNRTDIDMSGIQMELLEPGGRNGAMLLLDRPFFSGNSRLCLPEDFFNITDKNFNRLISDPGEGVAVWLKQGSSQGGWNGASISIAYNPRFQLARPGMVFFHRPGSKIKRVNGYAGIKLVFDSVYDAEWEYEYHKRVFENANAGHLNRFLARNENFEELKELERSKESFEFKEDFERIFENFVSGDRSLELRARFLELIYKLRMQEEHMGFCDRIKECLERDYRKNISLINLSKEEGVTPEHLCRSFKKVYGDSPVAYLIKVRLANARKLLLSTDLCINEIRDCCGFVSASYFYSAFKRSEGMAPGEYRDVFAGR